jgi:hypothetical protein
VVGFTTGSRGEVPGKKEDLWKEMMIIIIIIIIEQQHNNNNFGVNFVALL